jgi:hypothetical protein
MLFLFPCFMFSPKHLKDWSEYTRIPEPSRSVDSVFAPPWRATNQGQFWPVSTHLHVEIKWEPKRIWYFGQCFLGKKQETPYIVSSQTRTCCFVELFPSNSRNGDLRMRPVWRFSLHAGTTAVQTRAFAAKLPTLYVVIPPRGIQFVQHNPAILY